MPIANYGVLKGRPIGVKFAAGANNHYQIHIVDDTTDYRIAINVKSQLNPPDLQYIVIENFAYHTLNDLKKLPTGFTPIPSNPKGIALDFIRGNLFKRTDLKILAASIPGKNNDLNELIDKYIQESMSDESSLIYAFGQRWGPEANKKDKYFGFLPGNGIHDIHMNQGNSGKFAKDNGPWQDGGLLIQFSTAWVAMFFKFQSQTWHSDDTTGMPIDRRDTHLTNPGVSAPVVDTAGTADPEGKVRIVAALVNPLGDDRGNESVTILNASPTEIDLTGWAIMDKSKLKQALNGKISPGAILQVKLSSNVQLSNTGGLITLLDAEGLKVSGVSYTAEQAQTEGWSIVF
jgi:uncharacterized protein YukJ